MKKLTPFNRQKRAVYLFPALFFTLILLMSGCGDGGSGASASDPSETASATFSITWHDALDIRVQASDTQVPFKGLEKPPTPAAVQAQSVECGLIDYVACEVYDGADNDLTSETFPCSAHQGTIDNIPAGSNRKFVFLGVDADGNILYHGEITGVAISAGLTNNLGTVDAYYFIPESLSAAPAAPDRIELSWSASSDDTGIEGYNIYRDGIFLKSVSAAPASDTGLTPSTRYCYRISAFDATGNESGQGSQACATTLQAADTDNPTVPTGLSAAAVSSNTIALSWNAATDDTGVTGYNIYRGGVLLKSVSGTSASDTGLDPSALYCYRVSAFDAAGNESGQSGQACATTPPAVDTENPSTPTGLSAAAVSSNTIALSWNASTDNTGVAGYNIYRDGALLKSASGTSATDTDLDPSTLYCYRVSAFDAAGNESGQGGQACAETQAPPDTAPPSPDPMTWTVTPQAESTSEIFMWATKASDDSTPVTYLFEFAGSPTGGSGGHDSAWTDSVVYSNYGLDPNQQYGYRVRARDAEGNMTDYSATVYAFTLANMPGAPSETPFSNVTESGIRVSWTANGNPAGTQYYCENMSDGTNSGWTTALSWESTGLFCDTTYDFRVTARNGDGVITSWHDLGSIPTQYCSDISIMVGDDDGYGYGDEIVNGQDLPTSNDPVRDWIFDNRESVESSANDGSQFTDYEPYDSRQFSFTMEFPPVNPAANPWAVLIIDVSGIQQETFGGSSLYLDGVDYSETLPVSQGTFGSDIVYVYLYDLSILEDGRLTVDFQGGEGLNPEVWDPDTMAFDFFRLEIYYYGE